MGSQTAYPSFTASEAGYVAKVRGGQGRPGRLGDVPSATLERWLCAFTQHSGTQKAHIWGLAFATELDAHLKYMTSPVQLPWYGGTLCQGSSTASLQFLPDTCIILLPA